MFAYVHRLMDGEETVINYATNLAEVAKSYLAIIQCLSMIDPDDAWLMRRHEPEHPTNYVNSITVRTYTKSYVDIE
jgi:hypothetical protein